uniref:FXYD domain-containing ion transport regulator n=2 Tax=Amphiprion TaxID=80969 RepID=A0A3P8T5C4_AMPPE
MDLVVLVAFSSWLAPALGSAFGREVFASAADEDKDYDSAFQYDYESLRIGGLVFAVVLFLLGIALIVSRKCTCSKTDKSRSKGPDVESGVPRAQQPAKYLRDTTLPQHLSAVQPWPPQKQCFLTKVTLIMVRFSRVTHFKNQMFHLLLKFVLLTTVYFNSIMKSNGCLVKSHMVLSLCRL